MSSLTPPPTQPQGPPSGEFGPGQGAPPMAGSAPALPAPPQPPSPGALADVANIMNIVNSCQAIAKTHPQAVPVVKQINDLVQQLQMAIVQTAMPSEVPAPPM